MPSSQCYCAECTNTFTFLVCQRHVAFTALLASIAWLVRNLSNTNGLVSDAVQSGRIPHFVGTNWRRWISIGRHGVIFQTIDDYLTVPCRISWLRGMCDTSTRPLNWSLCLMEFFDKSSHAPALSVERNLYVFWSCKFIVRSDSCNISVFHVRVGVFNSTEGWGELTISDSGVWWYRCVPHFITGRFNSPRT